MSGTPFKTQNTLRFQLAIVEWVQNTDPDFHDIPFFKWKRHYLLKRLLTLQLKEFDNG